LGTIAKGTGIGVGKENLKQEEIATGQKTNEAATDYKPGETVVRNGVTFVKRSDGKWESQ
jgi:hypothetical protein